MPLVVLVRLVPLMVAKPVLIIAKHVFMTLKSIKKLIAFNAILIFKFNQILLVYQVLHRAVVKVYIKIQQI